jgi:hypothetical protein
VPAGDVTSAERLQLRKETVATVLALLVVGGTVGLALIAVLFMRGSDLSAAKDVLVVLSSLAGVVLGYYFGRIPSEARAEQSAQQAQQAQQVAATARSAAQSVGERALQMANEVSRIREGLVLQSALGTTRDIGAGAEPPADTIHGLQELQNDLENLARQARQV